MKGIIASPTIAPFIKESVIAYQEAEMLKCFCTTAHYHEKNPIIRTLSSSAKLYKELNRRNISEINIKHIKSLILPELLRIAANKFLNTTIADSIWEWAELNFDLFTANQLNKDTSFIHVYEHAALATLKTAKIKNILSIYEQPSQHHSFFSKIVETQLKLYPELKTAETDLLNNNKAVIRNIRRDNELLLADVILCNSSFTENTLIDAGITKEKLLKIPYGFPEVKEIRLGSSNPEKLRFIYAGNLSLRKGIHILLQAWKELHLDNIELFLVGKNQLPDFFWNDLPESVKRFDNLPQSEYYKLLITGDVFVMPTLADGFGMVITEAMAKGIPVLTTTASAGSDLISHGENGMLIPPGDKEALKNMLEWCINNRKALELMGNKALESAKAYPWNKYRAQLVKEVKSRIKS